MTPPAPITSTNFYHSVLSHFRRCPPPLLISPHISFSSPGGAFKCIYVCVCVCVYRERSLCDDNKPPATTAKCIYVYVYTYIYV